MIEISHLTKKFDQFVAIDDLSFSIREGEVLGFLGPNGAGKSTFLKILSGSQEANSGGVFLEPGLRMSVLEQNHNAYDNHPVLDTVLRGNKPLFKIIKQIENLYAKPDFSDSDGVKVGELQIEFEEMNGWNAESDAASLLSNLEISEHLHHTPMADLDGKQKVRVLLAQSLFGSPDVLIMDEPTNDLDYDTIMWLEGFLANYDKTVIVVSHDRHFLDAVCTHISDIDYGCLLYTSPSPRDLSTSRMPSSA